MFPLPCASLRVGIAVACHSCNVRYPQGSPQAQQFLLLLSLPMSNPVTHTGNSSASCRNTLQRPGAPSFSLPSLLLSLTSPSLPEPKFPSQSDSQWHNNITQHASTAQQGDSSTSPNHSPGWLCFEQQLPSCTALPLSQTAPSRAADLTGARAAGPCARQRQADPG